MVPFILSFPPVTAEVTKPPVDRSRKRQGSRDSHPRHVPVAQDPSTALSWQASAQASHAWRQTALNVQSSLCSFLMLVQCPQFYNHPKTEKNVFVGVLLSPFTDNLSSHMPPFSILFFLIAMHFGIY